MEPQKFDQYIKGKIAEADNTYRDLADSAKKGIWDKIGKGGARKRVLWSYAAASILIMMMLSGFFIYSLNKKNALISALTLENKNLKSNEQSLTVTNSKNTQIYNLPHKTDTVYVTKIKTENNVVELIKTVRDTIYQYPKKDSVIDSQGQVDEVKNMSKKAFAEINNEGLPTEYIFINQGEAKPNKVKEKKRHRLKIGNFENHEPEPESKSLSLLKTNF
jgi:hypothetical protein